MSILLGVMPADAAPLSSLLHWARIMPASKKVLAIVQARLNSERLPGKVLMPLCGDTLVGLHVARLQRASRIDQVVVATTENPIDDRLADYLSQRNIPVHRGPEDDVLARFAGAVRRFGGAVVTRTTADCPLVDPVLADRLVDTFLQPDRDVDHMAIALTCIPRGFDVEVMSAEALLAADRLATDSYSREHVTPYLYRNPDRFKSTLFRPDIDAGDLRLCIDEQSDYDMVSALAAEFDGDVAGAGAERIIAFLRARPDIAAINRQVKQR